MAIDLPRVVLRGPPNTGKSSLFNALSRRFAVHATSPAIVSAKPGTTRDFVTAVLDVDGIRCELVDLAGDDDEAAGAIALAAQITGAIQRRRAELRVRCVPCNAPVMNAPAEASELLVITKIDLSSAEPLGERLGCSIVTGAGINRVAQAMRARLVESAGNELGSSATSARCTSSLREAARALAAARTLAGSGGGDELLAAELRGALNALGDVVGAICSDEILDRVFSQFCIGK